MGRGLSRDWPGVEGARSQIYRVLRLRARLARSVVHVCALRAALRHQQPTRQLEYVSREYVGGSAGKHRRAGRHGDIGRLQRHRLHLLLRAERRQQQPAYAARSAGRGAPRRADRDLQSAARARPRRVHQPAGAGRDDHWYRDPDQLAISPAQGGRRHRRALRSVQGAHRGRRPHQGEWRRAGPG